MKILWVTPIRLLPVDAGPRIRTTNLLRELALRHSVKAVSLYRGRRPDGAYAAALAREFSDSEAIWLGNGVRASLMHRFPGQWTTAIGTGLSPNRRARVRLARLLRDEKFDVAVCDFVFAAPHIPADIAIPVVLFQHNVEWATRVSQAAHRRGGLVQLVDSWAIRRLREFEAEQLRRFQHTVAVSAEDARQFRKLAPAASVSWVPTGIDLDAFPPTPMPNSDRPLVVFSGMMSYFPNVDAVRWFCSEIWPRVLVEAPNARFRIVGRDPHADVRVLASPSVEITGRVESVAAHLREASVVVVPLRAGGGTRLKVYEAMATGRPIVATRLGPEGLDVTDGHDIVLADDPEVFAREVVSLLRNRDRAEAIGTAAAVTASRHSWPVVAARFEAILEEVVFEKRSGSF